MGRDVRSALKRQVTYEKQYLNSPLLVMNGFSGDTRELQLTSSMFQNMFPSINVANLKLSSVRRCVLLNRDEETGDIEFRHYTIKVVPVGLSKGVKKLVTGKIPNLGRYEDMSEFLASKGGGGQTSESEGEEDETSRVTLPQGVSARGALPQQQSAIRLVELGPRLTMKLIKIEDGLFDGEVLHHSLVEKTDEEKKAIRAIREKKKKEKEKRKKEQEINVKRKEQAKEEHKQKSLAGMHKKLKDEDLPKGFEGLKAKKGDSDGNDDADESDDDEEWYRREVGKAPDKDLFDGSSGHKRKGSRSGDGDVRFKKKRKMSDKSPGRGLGGKDSRGGGGPGRGRSNSKFKMSFDKDKFGGGNKRPSASGRKMGGRGGFSSNRGRSGSKPGRGRGRGRCRS